MEEPTADEMVVALLDHVRTVMEEAKKLIGQLPTDKRPPDDVLRAVEDLRKAARELWSTADYFVEGV